MSLDVEKPDEVKFYYHILLVCGVILLPGLFGAMFGWVHGLLPLIVFYLLHRYGKKVGGRYILLGCLLAGIACLMFQVVEQLLFSLTMLPAGFFLADSIKRGDSKYLSGIKTAAALAGSWLLLSTILATGLEHHPYTLLLMSINEGMDEAVSYYRANGSLPEETIYLLETTFQEMKTLLPRVMPAILSCIILLVVWFTMVAGNQLLSRKTGHGPWPQYRFWTLPDKLIWLLILSAILVALPMEPSRTVGLNLLLVTGLLYCFQGMAIVLFYFYKWSIPHFLRAIIYVILFFQSFGAIFLAILGVVDIWFDLRRLHSTENETDI
ncbi:MAG: YybS family protein [Proteobacteria bacterium]|nr:YybS family protein [Pseudomonadota bacterium]MBU1059328.1 YybS family protein [Pseudomonadota bacterium]